MTDVTYAIADLHGRSDLLALALDAVAADAVKLRRGSRTVVTLGDYVDRGPDARGVIDRLMAGARPGWRLVCLRGNHEQMLLDHHDGRDPEGEWLEAGGSATLASYAEGAVAPEHLAWMRGLALIFWDAHRVFVHADVDPLMPLDHQDAATMLWSRHRDGLGHGDRHVVVGHVPSQRNPRSADGRTDLDTLAWRSGRLAVAVFDDAKPGGPARIIEVGAQAGG